MKLEDWYKQLSEAPGDWDLRRIFCDWLEEQGDERRRKAQRWQIENGRYPHQLGVEGGSKFLHLDLEVNWVWTMGKWPIEIADYHSQLPEFLGEYMKWPAACHETLISAEETLMKALEKASYGEGKVSDGEERAGGSPDRERSRD